MKYKVGTRFIGINYGVEYPIWIHSIQNNGYIIAYISSYVGLTINSKTVTDQDIEYELENGSLKNDIKGKIEEEFNEFLTK